MRALVVACVALMMCSCVDDTPSSQQTADAATQAALVEDGREIAEVHCASCHAIGTSGESPNRDAPWFRGLLSRYNADMLETELAEGMRVAHEPMPQFDFRPAEAGALIAYMRSVQTRDPGRALAEQRCARCHATDLASTSPYPGTQPFRNLGRRWRRGQLRDALRTGIIVEHDKAEARVPPMKLTDPEIDVFLAYLDALATPEYPAPKAP